MRKNLKKNSRVLTCFPSLENFKTLPTNADVSNRRKTLQNAHIGKTKKKFLYILAKEIHQCWKNQDIPVQRCNFIYNKLMRCETPNNDDLFDCLPLKPIWKSKEDNEYYSRQKNKLGGYTTSKMVACNIHSSKKIKQQCEESEDVLSWSESDDEETNSVTNDFSDFPDFNDNGNETGDVAFAEELREMANLSIAQSIAVMKFYKAKIPDCHHIPRAPCKGALSMASRKAAVNISQISIRNAASEFIYFDMKQYQRLFGTKREIICICMGNHLVEFTEIPNKRSETIASVLLKTIGEKQIMKIVSDTEPTITGSKNGVIQIIRRNRPNVIYEPCRLHILDLIIKNEINFYLGQEKSTDPGIPFKFVQDMRNNWSDLRRNYLEIKRIAPISCTDLPADEDRRDDYRYLLNLCKCLRTKRECGHQSDLKIPIQPINISSARWNSKAIYCLMAELFNQKNDANIQALNNFIAYEWAPVWFGVRSETNWSNLRTLSEKSRNILDKFNLKEKMEYQPPTNELAERVFRMAEEKIPRCSNIQNLRDAMIRYVNVTAKLNAC